jgi:hypothetical protein
MPTNGSGRLSKLVMNYPSLTLSNLLAMWEVCLGACATLGSV